jgi:hypothetical protein
MAAIRGIKADLIEVDDPWVVPESGTYTVTWSNGNTAGAGRTYVISDVKAPETPPKARRIGDLVLLADGSLVPIRKLKKAQRKALEVL